MTEGLHSTRLAVANAATLAIILSIIHLITHDTAGYFDAFTYFHGFSDATSELTTLSIRMQSSPLFFFSIGHLSNTLASSPFDFARILNTILIFPNFLLMYIIGRRLFTDDMKALTFAYFLTATPTILYTFASYYYDGLFNLLQAAIFLSALNLWTAKDERSYRRALILGVAAGAFAQLVRGQGLAIIAPFAAIVFIEALVHQRGKVKALAYGGAALIIMIAPYACWVALTHSIAPNPSMFEVGYLDGINRLFGHTRYFYDLDAQTIGFKAPPIAEPYGFTSLLNIGVWGTVALLFGEVVPQFVSLGIWTALGGALRTSLLFDALLLPVFVIGALGWLLQRTRKEQSSANRYLALSFALFGPLWIAETFVQVRTSYYTSMLFPLAFLWVNGLVTLRDALARALRSYPEYLRVTKLVLPLGIFVSICGGFFYVMTPFIAAKLKRGPDYSNVDSLVPAGSERAILIIPSQQEKFAGQIVPFIPELLELSDTDTRKLLRSVDVAVIPEDEAAAFAERVSQAGGTAVEQKTRPSRLRIYDVTFSPKQPAPTPEPM